MVSSASSDDDLTLTDRRGRLRGDFVLAIMMSVGAVAATVIAAFAVYRYLSGNLIGALTNCLIVAALTSVLVYAWRSGNTTRAASIFVLVTGLACVVSSLVFGHTGVYWTYLVLWINFVLTRRATAMFVNLAMIAAFAGQASLFQTPVEHAIYLVTAILITAYGWILSTRSESQRLQLERLAHHDALTDAGNRRLLNRDLERAISAMRTQGSPAVLALLDLDHFKRVNDSLGHEVGDRVLVRLVEIARQRLRAGDGLYRFGGEEFIVLLPSTGLIAGGTALADLRQHLNAGLQRIAADATVSAGVAQLHSGEDWSHWLGRADAALYLAKQEGRDSLVVADDPDASAVHHEPQPAQG